MSLFYFDTLTPGWMSAILFIVMDILVIGLLDVVLTRVVCIVYFRNVNNGQPIVVKSADIPGLTHFLIGNPLSVVNVVAVLCKIGLLAIIFVGNININDSPERLVSDMRDATFYIEPNNSVLSNATLEYAVRRRFDRSKFCMIRDSSNDEKNRNDTYPASLAYYPLRFNLANGDSLAEDVVVEVGDTDEPRYDIDDERVICMSPTETGNEEPLQNVLDCSRRGGEDISRCKSITSAAFMKDAVINTIETRPREFGRLVSTIFIYNQSDVDDIFSEYANFSTEFTCLSTNLDDTDKQIAYTHCLLIAFNTTTPSAPQTIVERWIVEQYNGTRKFVLPYRGVIFEGLFKFPREAAENLLENLYMESDYESLSGDLVAVSSMYRALNESEKRFMKRDRKQESEQAYVTISKVVVGLLVASLIMVLIGFVVTTLLLIFDKRPRFNTINGLSSIVREEYAPTGRSYDDQDGKRAILGLRFTKDDKMHFGPIENYDEATKLQDGYDIF